MSRSFPKPLPSRPAAPPSQRGCRPKEGKVECTLSHHDLAKRILHHDFSDLDLTGLNFAGLDMGRANFSGSILWGTDFTGTTLFLANFRGSKCVHAKFRGESFLRADFRGAMGLTPEERTYLRNRGAFVDD